MNNEKCPKCGKSHYTTGATFSTLMYFPPEWKDGVNINPDRNTHTTEAHCCECGENWTIINQPPPQLV
jgi:rRNA maturation protein Nop10